MDYSLMSDEELVTLCKANNEAAFSVLTSRYTEKARLTASSFRNVSIENDDLVQEAMIGFLSAVYSFSENKSCSFSTYSVHCMKNRILSIIRSSNSKKRIPYELVVPLEQTQAISDIAPSAEESFISQREAEYISSIISLNLTKQENEIFMLYLKGMSYEEIAKITAITPKAVDGTLQRARKKLREKLSL